MHFSQFSYLAPSAQAQVNRSAGGATPSLSRGKPPSTWSHCAERQGRTGWYRSFEIAVGALLLLSPMFWLFIAELIK